MLAEKQYTCIKQQKHKSTVKISVNEQKFFTV